MINGRVIVGAAILLVSIGFAAQVYSEHEVFTITPQQSEQPEKKSLREKKYAELEEELVRLYEEVLQLQIEKLIELGQAQKSCVESFKKVLINKPQMSRERLQKEIERVQKLIDSVQNITFF